MPRIPSPFQDADEYAHDFGPWIESTRSSRSMAYRYDYATHNLMVSWKNERGHVVTSYERVGSDVYRRFAQSASPGRFVNRVLNGYGYWPSTTIEVDAGSNPMRKEVKHREQEGWNP